MGAGNYVEHYEHEGRRGDHQARMRHDAFHLFLADAIDTSIRERKPQSLLDVGCAEGRYIFSAISDISIGVGIDVSETKLRRAVCKAKELGAHDKTLFTVADAQDLPFADGAFDVVICSQVLEHLVNPEAALREFARVSASHIILSVPVWSPCSPMGFGSPRRSRDYDLKKDGHIHWFTAAKLRRMVNAAGLHVCKVRPISGRYPLRRLLAFIPGIARLWLTLDRAMARYDALTPFAYRILMVCAKKEA